MEQSLLPDNSPDQIRQRRAQNTLIIIGGSVILFGIWSIFKSIGVLFITKDELLEDVRNAIQTESEPISEGLALGIVVAGILIILAIIILIRIIIGLSAIKAGRNKKHGFIYIPLTILMILASWLQIVRGLSLFLTAVEEEASGDTSLMSVVIEITSMIMMIEMLVSAARLRKYRKKAGKGKERQAS